ncbi:Uncharacterised protein [Mycolicibacterium aurum]|uniref:Transmembrane protein n=1 Tax=Mycolicibacterium aurum TaxID=1791 RepID=A0A3S4SPX4_MYCAU|nr:Uncharacterised protein [Mycolicibacterium aurum]
MKPVSAVAVVTVMFGGVGMFSTLWALQLLDQGRYPSMFVAIGFAVFAFGVLAQRVIVAMGKVSPRVEYNDGGTLLRPDPKVSTVTLVGTLAAFAALLLYGICASSGIAELPGLAGDQRWLGLASIAAAILGLPSLWRIATQGGVGYLRLTTKGFEVGDAWSRGECGWDELSDVADRPRHKPWLLFEGSTYVTTSDGRTRTLASDWYTPGGRAVRKLVRFYWKCPECRDELADGRAARRLADPW